MVKLTSAVTAWAKRVKPILVVSLVMLMPLALAACPTHTHIHG